MTEKQEIAKRSESLLRKILQRLISIIPYLLLSSGIVFFLFKYFYENFDNSLRAVALGIIATGAIASVISITVGYIYKNREFGCTLAFLIPVVSFMEAAIQFGQPWGDVFIITYMALFLAIFVHIFVYNMLLPLVDTNNIRPEDVICIQIFSPIADVARYIGEALRCLNITKVKTSIAGNVRQ